MKLLSELNHLLQGQLRGPDALFSAINTDTRCLRAGDLFVALVGERFDGHDFVASAQAQGAVAAIVQRPVMAQIPLLIVADTRQALGRLAQQHRAQFFLPVIALTGSCGKTTTKEMLHAILKSCGPVLASVKSFNNDIGVPLTLLRLKAEHRFAVIEMGANHPGEIAYLTQLARPEVVLITGVAAAHLQGFGSIKGVAQAKAEILEGLGPKGTAIINADDPFASYWQALVPVGALIRFGIQNKADCMARSIRFGPQGQAAFELLTPQGDIDVQLALIGRHNVSNALAATVAALAVGAPLKAIKLGLETMSPVPGRLLSKRGLGGTQILDDTYNASPSSVEAALQALAYYSGQRVFVFGGMLELGTESTAYHRQVGERARQLGIDHVYTYGELARPTAEAFGQQAQHFSSKADLLATLRRGLQAGMTLLVKGSRATAMEQVVVSLQIE